MKIQLPETSKDRIYETIAGEGGNGAKKTGYARKLMRAAVIAASVCIGSGTVYAAYRWMNAGEVASMLGKSALAEKFNKTDEEIQIQENDVYRVTYLGEVSGKNLSEQEIEAGEDKTYFVMAIEKKDGSEITDDDDSFVASPFIKGIAPWQFNIFYLGGGATSCISDNVIYKIIECSNVEIFADKGIYLGITEHAPGKSEYRFDEKSGGITRNPDCEGTNFLFALDVDKAKADPAKAEQLLRQIEQDAEDDDAGEEEDLSGLTEEERADAKKLARLEKQAEKDMEDVDEMVANSTLVKGSVKEMTEQENGYLTYSYKDFTCSEERDVLKKAAEGNKKLLLGSTGAGNSDSYEVEVIVAEQKDGKFFGKMYRRVYK